MPESLRNVFSFLWQYQHPKATVWKADFIEIVLWEYDGDSKKSVAWPKIEDKYKVTFKNGNQQFCSIFVIER